MTSSCMIRNQNTNNNYNHQQEEKEEGCVRSTKMAHQRQSISTVETTKIDDDDEDDEEVSLEFVMSSSSAASAHDDSTGDAETDAHADVLNQNNSKSLSSLPTVVSEGNIRALAARANTHHHHPEPHSPHRMQRRVSFSECVSVRNHLHAADMSDNERSEAWFNGDDYHSIYKTNSKIIRNISKLQKEKEKEAKKAAKKAHKAATKGSGGFPRRGSLSQLFSSSKKKKKDKPHKKKHEPPPPAAVPSTPQQQQQQQAHENQHEDQHEDLDDNDADLAEDDMQEIARFMNKVQGLEEAAASSHEPPSHEETRRNGAEDTDDNTEDADVEDIEEEERRGFSIRGLEQEERSKRRVRDQVYFEAKCTVLSIQEELLSHREAMPDGFCRTTPTRNQRWNDEADAAAACYSDEDDDDDDEEETANTPRDHLAVERDISRNKVALALSLTSSSAAAASSSSASSSTITVQQRTTYSYYDRIAERYTGICSQSAREARQRGMRDEVIAQKISTLAEQHRQRRLRSLSSNPTNTNTNSTNTTTTTQPSASNKKRASRRWSLL